MNTPPPPDPPEPEADPGPGPGPRGAAGSGAELGSVPSQRRVVLTTAGLGLLLGALGAFGWHLQPRSGAIISIFGAGDVGPTREQLADWTDMWRAQRASIARNPTQTLVLRRIGGSGTAGPPIQSSTSSSGPDHAGAARAPTAVAPSTRNPSQANATTVHRVAGVATVAAAEVTTVSPRGPRQGR